MGQQCARLHDPRADPLLVLPAARGFGVVTASVSRRISRRARSLTRARRLPQKTDFAMVVWDQVEKKTKVG